jgi:hypothetical protein
MYVLLNGSFGVGKSHVARELRRFLPDSAIADPEWIGLLLQHGARRHRSDFQHSEIRAGLAETARPVLHFCLVAPLELVRERLARRGEPVEEVRWAWVHRRAAECCAVHAGPEFAPRAMAWNACGGGRLVVAQLPGRKGPAYLVVLNRAALVVLVRGLNVGGHRRFRPPCSRDSFSTSVRSMSARQEPS